MKTIIFISILISLISTIYTQTITWSKVYGTSEFNEHATRIKQLQNGDYIVMGTNDSGVQLLKIDSFGDSIWSKKYSIDNMIPDIELGINNNYIIATTKYYTVDTSALYVLWVDENGDSVKSNSYFISYNTNFILDVPRDIDKTSDSCYVIVGRTSLYACHDGFIIKINDDGDSLWTSFSYLDDMDFRSVVEGSDGCYLTAIDGHPHYSVEKFDSLGQHQSVLCSLGGFVTHIEMLADSNFVYRSWAGPVVKINENLDTIWTRPGIGCGDVAPCSDGGFVVTGSCNNDLFLTKFNTDGDSLWTVTYGGGGVDVGRCVEQTSDGGFIICGSTTSYGTGSADFYIIKTDSAGYALGVEEELYSEIVHSNGFMVEYLFSGSVKISFFSTLTDDLALKLYDVTGREIESSYTTKTENNRTCLVIRNLNRGVYFFRIEGENRSYQGKFTIITDG
ncbi:MAG: hypothetical protein APR63_05225 [Desulfuromonas sp. SDB]|nr:MAG: hypothetical protein APR63_05225 [Desulfuromonas sp. SDB]